MFLIPLEWGGENLASNTVMATRELADAKRRLDIALVPLIQQGELSHYEANSYLKTRMLVCGAEIDHEGNIIYKYPPASKHRDYLTAAIAAQTDAVELESMQDDFGPTTGRAICYCIDSDLEPSVDSASMAIVANKAFSLRRIFAKAEINESTFEFFTARIEDFECVADFYRQTCEMHWDDEWYHSSFDASQWPGIVQEAEHWIDHLNQINTQSPTLEVIEADRVRLQEVVRQRLQVVPMIDSIPLPETSRDFELHLDQDERFSNQWVWTSGDSYWVPRFTTY